MIGIDRYRSWDRLDNAVGDAKGALDVFLRIGFELVGNALYDEQATGDALRRLVTDDLAVLGSSDSLVVFFAGHGHTVSRTYHGGATVKDGYIIPVDGDRPGGRMGTWVRLETWLSDLTRIPAKHVLVMIDACHSGLALGPVIQWRSRSLAVELHEPLERLRARRSRRIITSALEDQLAMDGGPILGHSLFTGCLIEALTGGLIANTGRLTVTGSEIAQYVQRRVSEYPDSRQTPDFGALALDDRGELLIHLSPAERHPRASRGKSSIANVETTAAPLAVPTNTRITADATHAKNAQEAGAELGAEQIALERPAQRVKTSPGDVAKRIAVPIPASVDFIKRQPDPRNGDERTPAAVKLPPHVETVAAALANTATNAAMHGQLQSLRQGSGEAPNPLLRKLALIVTATTLITLGFLLWLWKMKPFGDAHVPHVAYPVVPDAAAAVPDDAAGLDAPALTTIITRSNPFIDVDGVRVQLHQVTRREYAAYLATLGPDLRVQATPRIGWDESAPDDPVTWTRFEQATRFCAEIGARLPTFVEWTRASRGSWGIDPVGDQRGPLREWTSDVDDGWIRVAGATAAMTAAQRSKALKDKLLLASAASFAHSVKPDEVDISSREVGIRCVQ